MCFEEQGIDTSELAGEFLTAIFAMMDQKESENISDNLRWSIDMRMRAGKYNTCTAPFGYRLVKGKLELIPDQAAVIRYIYDAYLSGKTAGDIAAELNLFSEGKPWKAQRIDYILTNERYSGNAVLRKRYTTDALRAKLNITMAKSPCTLWKGSMRRRFPEMCLTKHRNCGGDVGTARYPEQQASAPLPTAGCAAAAAERCSP